MKTKNNKWFPVLTRRGAVILSFLESSGFGEKLTRFTGLDLSFYNELRIGPSYHLHFTAGRTKNIGNVKGPHGRAQITREFSIPCIIGTGNATQVLRDGDLVEVDAYTGTITKL